MTTVVNSHGRTHDHDTLFVMASPTIAGLVNGTLSVVVLTLRSFEWGLEVFDCL